MSAAATAAGYLYASGRLRGRVKEGPETEKREKTRATERHEANVPVVKRRPVRVAALPDAEYPQAPSPVRARPAPRIEYRVRRWRPDE
jgi:hypothetical protein